MRTKQVEGSRNFDTSFFKALAPVLVLHLLSEEPKYIYQMAVEISKRAGGKYEALALYPVVNRLISDGYVEDDHQCIADNRVRSFYRITDSGRAQLLNLVSQFEEMHEILDLVIGNEVFEQYKKSANK